MIDFHCHLDLYPEALNLLPKVQLQTQFTFAVTTSPRAFLATSKVFSEYTNIHVGLGLHPEVATAKAGELPLLIELIKTTPLIGEIGLDGSSRFSSSLHLQEKIFRAVLAACESVGGRVMSIHSRGAEQRVLDALAAAPSSGTPVLHWFSGSQGDLRRAINQGAWFSVGPAMLKGERGRQLAAAMPPDRVLPETDGPFALCGSLPYMPWHAWDACDSLGRLWNMPCPDVEAQMMKNLGTLVGHPFKE